MSERVVRGRIFRVENKDRKFGSAENYNFISVQDTRTPQQKTCSGYDSEGEAFEYVLPQEYELLFTDAEIMVARSRALKNQEDLLQKSFISDLTDDL